MRSRDQGNLVHVASLGGMGVRAPLQRRVPPARMIETLNLKLYRWENKWMCA